jgi:hypothetical protein
MTETVKTPQVSGIEVIASGLDSPRKLSFGPDDALYVAEAGRGGTGASISPSPSQPGAFLSYGATGGITRIEDGEVYADGFTNISDLAFDRSGGLYVLEYDADGILNGSDAGALIYVSPDGKTRTTIADDELINPTGLEIGSDGDIYISNKGFIAGQGEVLRLSFEEDILGSASSDLEHYDAIKNVSDSL